MKLDPSATCPHCGSSEQRLEKVYETVHNGARQLFYRLVCGKIFSETHGTPRAELKTPLSKVAGVLRVRSEGLGVRATARVFGIHKNTVTEWESRFAEQKDPLLLYAVCHEFIHLTFEGDELYTVVRERGDASDSKGWTAVVMERAGRFIVEQRCGPKDAPLFEAVMSTVAAYLEHSDEATFLSDGERRYGNALFALCAETLREDQRGSSGTSSGDSLLNSPSDPRSSNRSRVSRSRSRPFTLTELSKLSPELPRIQRWCTWRWN